MTEPCTLPLVTTPPLKDLVPDIIGKLSLQGRDVSVQTPQPTAVDQDANVPYENEEGNVNSLPPELLSLIFSFLDVKSVGKAAQICKSWKTLIMYDGFLKKTITDCALDKLGLFPINESREALIPHLFNTWRTKLAEYASSAPVFNGLSTASIPLQWKKNLLFTDYREFLYLNFNELIFTAIADHQDTPIDTLVKQVAFYLNNQDPVCFSEDFCAALCEGINEDAELTGLSITSNDLNDEKVMVIAQKLQNRKMKHLHLFGNFGEAGILAIAEALPSIVSTVRTSGDDYVQIELLAQDCSVETEELFNNLLTSLNLSGHLIVKSRSTLYYSFGT